MARKGSAVTKILPVLLLVVLVVGILAPVWWGGGFPATKDTVLTNLPWAVYHSQSLQDKESLFWCHYGGCGFPVHAESQGGFFHPLNILTAKVCSQPWTYPVRWVLALVAGALAMYGFLRTRMMSVWAAFIGALAYALGGFWIARLDMLPLLLAAPVLPLGWLAVEWLALGRWSRGVAVGIAALAWGLLAGHFQLTAISLLGIFLYAIGRGWTFRRPIPVLTGVVVMCLVAAGIAALQLLPTLELAARSSRLAAAKYFAGDYSLFPAQVVGMLFPRVFGFQRTVTFNTNDEWSGGDYWGSGVFWEACPYVGAALLVLALLAIITRRPGTVWLATIAVAGLLLAFGKYTPVWSGIQHLPGFSVFRIPSRFLLLTAASVAALGGIGADTLAHGLKRHKTWGAGIIAMAVALAMVLWIVSAIIPESGSVTEWTGLTGERLQRTLSHAPETLPPWVPDQAVPLSAMLLLGIAILLKVPRAWVAVIIALEMGWFAVQTLPPSMDYDRLISDAETPAPRPAGRIYSVPLYQSGGTWNRIKALPANVNWLYGISRPDARGSLFDIRQTEYIQTAEQEFLDGRHQLLALAGVQSIITHRPLSDPGLEMYAGGEVFAYQIQDAVPLAYFPLRVRSPVSGENMLATLADSSFDVGTAVLLEGWKGVVVSGAESQVAIEEWGRGRIELETQGEGGILKICESYDPGWLAMVDGKTVPILRADYLFMALQVPEGKHQVTIFYQPPGYKTGVVLSIAGMVLWLGFWLLPIRKPHKVDVEEGDIYQSATDA
jgi:hypothetical protein